jgi:pilus assembly protein CpaF
MTLDTSLDFASAAWNPGTKTNWESERSPADPAIVARIAQSVGEELANERITRTASGRSPLDQADERQLIRRLIARQLDLLAASKLSSGLEPLDADGESDVTTAVIDAVLGLGRIQPLLENPDVTDIHIRGFDSVWLKLRDGTRVQSGPVANSDDDLVDLIRRVATRSGRSERRLDAANPELNLQLPDLSRHISE